MTDVLNGQITSILANGTQGVPISALQYYLEQKQSGRLTCLDPEDYSVGWRVYFSGGHIHFAESIMGHSARLPYLLQDALPHLDLSLDQGKVSTYDWLYQQLEAQKISLSDLRSVVAKITQEALIQLLAVTKATLLFEPHANLDPLLFSGSFWNLVLPVEDLIWQWSMIRPEVSSPFWRPYIKDWNQFGHQGCYVTDGVCRLQTLADALNQNQCLYQLAHQLHLDAQDLAVMLHPLVKSGALGMDSYQVCALPKRPVVFCIDASKLTRHWIRRILEPMGYEVVTLQQSEYAQIALQRYAPDVVIVDTQMAAENNYQLCRLLSRIPLLQQTPIVLLTPADSLIDRIRTRLSGATAHLTKPFHPKALQSLVMHLVPPPPVSMPQSSTFL